MRHLLIATLVAAQTVVTAPDNKYSPADDVKLGQEAKAEAEKQLPIMRDDEVTSYIEDVGQKLVAAIPPELRHPEFHYTFQVVNVRDINAFALPGGPMFVNRGMIQAARSEGEVAGVMAHELSHVVLRHGTAQASKAQKYQIGELAGLIAGAIIGGKVGTAVAQGTQFGLGTYFMRFSREFEQQADIEGSHIMAMAGYDPRDMASMFKTIEKQGGSGSPEWLSDHPNPGNRVEYITREAESLRVENPIRDTRAFSQVQSHLKKLAPAPTTAEATKNTKPNGPGGGDSRAPSGRVEPPSGKYVPYTQGNLFRVDVPSNWHKIETSATTTFAPQGAFGQYDGASIFTHGVEFGSRDSASRDLQTATDDLIESLSRSNPRLSRAGSDRVTVAKRDGLRTTLTNLSEATGQQETIVLSTTLLPNGSLLYILGVAPSDVFRDYQGVFKRIVGSIEFLRDRS